MKIPTVLLLSFFLVGLHSARAVPETGLTTMYSHGRKGGWEELCALSPDSIREPFYWKHIEQTPGQYQLPENYRTIIEECRKRKIKLLPIACYGNPLYTESYPVQEKDRAAFVEYAAWLAGQTEGVSDSIEIWNEWNIRIGVVSEKGGLPLDYVHLLKDVYTRLKKDFPNRKIIACAPASGLRGQKKWFKDCLEGGMGNYCDALALHPYVYNLDFPSRTAEGMVAWVGEIRDEIRSSTGKECPPLYITELGWPDTPGGGGLTPEFIAAQTARTLLLLPGLRGVNGLWWYEFRNRKDGVPEDKEMNFGLMSRDLKPKPAFDVFRETRKFTAEFEWLEKIPLENTDLTCLRFKSKDTDALVLWSISGAVYPLEIHTSSPPRPLDGTVFAIPGVEGKWLVEIGSMPVVIKGAKDKNIFSFKQ